MGAAKRAAAWLTLLIVIAGCAAPAPTQSSDPSSRALRGLFPESSAGPRRLTAAVMGSTRSFSSKIERAGAGSTPGSEEIEEMMNAGLSILDGRGVLRPLLAEVVPSVENGRWQVFPDGRMETTWTLKRGVQWHDGAPLTSEDLVFTAAVVRDRELPAFRELGYDSMDQVEAVDRLTVTVRWKQPYIEADTLFTRVRAQPLPRHLLEQAYLEDKANFIQHPYWSVDFVGLGPFKLREYVQGSHALLSAYEAYVLGRPKLDEIEVKFIPDQNTLVANILAGAVELTLGRSLSLEQAVLAQDQWRDGKMDLGALSSWIAIYPQFINPNPAVISNLQFRRAVYQAVDRQQMADEFMLGLAPVAYSIVSPQDPAYPSVEASIVRYDYDQRRATQLIEALGYARGADGMFRDAAGQPLVVQTQTSVGNALQEKSMFAVGEYLRRAGIGVEPDIVSAQARTDRARRSTRTGFEVQKQPSGVSALPRYHGSSTPLPENNFVGNNRSRYRSPEFDALLNRYFTTIPTQEREQVLGQIIHHMTDQLNVMGLIYDADPTMMGNRLVNVEAARAPVATVAWNSHQWSVK